MPAQDRDPRTAGAPGIAFLMAEADLHMSTLCDQLGPHERVERFVKDAAIMSPRLIALTATRLISIKGVTSSSLEASLPRPLAVSVSGRPGKWTVTVAASDGRRFSLKTERSEDVLALQAADRVGPTGPPPSSRVNLAAGHRSHDGWMPSRAAMSWQDAELIAAEHMRHLGFLDAHQTASGPDGGLDVVATNAAAQVKFHAVPAGSPAIQQLAGAAYAHQNKLFYATGYSSDGRRWADEVGIALFRITEFSGVEAVNDVALRLQDRTHAAQRPDPAFASMDKEIWLTINWCNQVIQAAGWNTTSGRTGKTRQLLEDRKAAVELAQEAFALLDKLNDVRLGHFRRTMVITEAQMKAKKAAKKLGLRLK